MRNVAFILGFALGTCLNGAALGAEAQEAGKVFRIGSLSPAGNPALEGVNRPGFSGDLRV